LGNSGTGKSTFINRIRNVKKDLTKYKNVKDFKHFKNVRSPYEWAMTGDKGDTTLEPLK